MLFMQLVKKMRKWVMEIHWTISTDFQHNFHGKYFGHAIMQVIHNKIK